MDMRANFFSMRVIDSWNGQYKNGAECIAVKKALQSFQEQPSKALRLDGGGGYDSRGSEQLIFIVDLNDPMKTQHQVHKVSN
jgi:hypothetical protein